MFKAGHTALIILSGLVWLVIGLVLLSLGLNFIAQSLLQENMAIRFLPFIHTLTPFVGSSDVAGLLLIVAGLITGYSKGRFVLSKTVHKGVSRITSLPNPAHLKDMYSKKYYILLGSMVFLGFLFRFTPSDIRGFVDIAIGSALINGSILYFRLARKSYKKPKHLYSNSN